MLAEPHVTFENSSPILTDRLILRRFTADDVKDYLLIMSDEDTNAFLPWFPIKNLDEAKEHLTHNYLEPYRSCSTNRYAICLKTDNRPIGYVGANQSDSKDFGYALRKEFWHMGIVTEASKAVVERMKNAGYLFITATHDRNNPRSGEVMKKIGMKYFYSYEEQWQPKDILVIFRMYQLNFDGACDRVYLGYWNKYANHFIESEI